MLFLPNPITFITHQYLKWLNSCRIVLYELTIIIRKSQERSQRSQILWRLPRSHHVHCLRVWSTSLLVNYSSKILDGIMQQFAFLRFQLQSCTLQFFKNYCQPVQMLINCLRGHQHVIHIAENQIPQFIGLR